MVAARLQNRDFVEMENAEVDEGEDMINLDDDGRIG